MNCLEEGRRVFDLEIEALMKTRDSLDGVFDALVEAFTACEGKIITSGIGKSGHIAKKIAATLSSLGTPSFFLDAADALHGDLGMIDSKDIVMFICNSGETDEIKAMIPVLKENGTKITAITGKRGSTLAREADIVAVLPEFPEACHFGLAPTSSTTAMLCYADAIAVAISIKKGFGSKDFHRIHPSGELSKK